MKQIPGSWANEGLKHYFQIWSEDLEPVQPILDFAKSRKATKAETASAVEQYLRAWVTAQYEGIVGRIAGLSPEEHYYAYFVAELQKVDYGKLAEDIVSRRMKPAVRTETWGFWCFKRWLDIAPDGWPMSDAVGMVRDGIAQDVPKEQILRRVEGYYHRFLYGSDGEMTSLRQTIMDLRTDGVPVALIGRMRQLAASMDLAAIAEDTYEYAVSRPVKQASRKTASRSKESSSKKPSKVATSKKPSAKTPKKASSGKKVKR